MSIHVGKLPGRKRPVLYRKEGGTIWPLAYFVSEQALKEFMLHKPLALESSSDPNADPGLVEHG